ncbi:amino acid permease [Streptomyces rugosispiralis]|uniref:Amino acid permease n=1 Tax=Streptomyces rugosispiralis TaxID=2967341 RepID=A0ABT1V953_9ACTN|nr:amino acid permease [Streptomyces rugosispiralis]MCQ8193930.1 amino acid permease [Streptomyces rugosispiralis]
MPRRWGARGRRFKSCRPDQHHCRSEAVFAGSGGGLSRCRAGSECEPSGSPRAPNSQTCQRCLFAVGLSTGGGPSIFWIAIVGLGQFLVALVFGEVVSQFPLAGGLYQWVRRLWNGRYAWFTAWTYICCITIGIT